MEKQSDLIDLVARIKRQYLLAMKVIYQQYAREMLTLSYRITKSKEDSEEIIQNAFLYSFEKINQLKDARKYRAWLKRSVMNRSLTKLKDKWRPIDLPEHLEDTSDNRSDSDAWLGDISLDKIRAAIFDLPEGCRQVLTLFLFENYKHREIAELLGISESTSKSQYRYALKLLRTDVSKYYR